MPSAFMIVSSVALAALLLFDLVLVTRRPHVPSMREASAWVGFYVALAIVFAGLLLAFGGREPAGSFVAGWLTEYSLSVDNLFVFVLIMARFSVPRAFQQKVLMIGIIMSLVLRGGFILLGAAAIQRFSWVFYLFGGFLVYTAVQLVRSSGEQDEEYEENALIRRARRILPVTEGYDGAKLRVRRDGTWMFTPMVIVFLAIGSTDLLFALDSIPAIFGLTKDAFIVFTATVFALMGLRQLYFLLGGLLERLVYLSYGLALILGFIGVKLVLEALHENELPFINGGDHVSVPVIPIWLSLVVIAATLLVTAGLSIIVSARRPAHQAAAEAVVQPGESDQDNPPLTTAVVPPVSGAGPVER